MSAYDGGPAFPGYWENDTEANATAPDGAVVPPMTQHGISGMSLRDYFAAKALQGMIACSPEPALSREDQAKVAVNAYRFADAMLAERPK